MGNFSCLVKSVVDESIVEIETFYKPLMFDKKAGKLIFKLNSKHKIDLNELVVAVIWKQDYNKSLVLKEFIKNFDEKNSNNRVILPFELIKYQIPTIIQSITPRLPSVDLCIHYTYEVPYFIINWIDNNLRFGIRKIMFYDGTYKSKLTKQIRNYYGENKKLIIRPYDMTFESLCHPSILLKQFEYLNLNDKIKKYLTDSCKDFFNGKFIDKHKFRSFHEQVSVNDCFTVLKEQYEFIAHFDLDEFIFPRNYKTDEDFYKKNVSYSCDDGANKICPMKVFSNSFESERSDQTNDNYFYNYLMEIIKKEITNKQKLSQLGSIYFQDSPFIKPGIDENNLIEKLGIFLKDYDRIKTFPYHLKLSAPPYTSWHMFAIEKEDFSYVQYLYNSYKTFISCVYNRYLNKSTKMNSNLVRYFYFNAEPDERPTKAIHYYKNTNTIFIHRPIDFVKPIWRIQAPYKTGHFLSHFRTDIGWLYNTKMTGSIRKLNLDFEYVIFLLKNFTSYCYN